MPKRIQLRRTKGWRKPEGAVVVSRPSIFGNPFPVGAEMRWDCGGVPRLLVLDRELSVGLFRIALTSAAACPGDSVDRWRRKILTSLRELRGKDLCCWCPLDKPCHADVLLELANQSP